MATCLEETTWDMHIKRGSPHPHRMQNSIENAMIDPPSARKQEGIATYAQAQAPVSRSPQQYEHEGSACRTVNHVAAGVLQVLVASGRNSIFIPCWHQCIITCFNLPTLHFPCDCGREIIQGSTVKMTILEKPSRISHSSLPCLQNPFHSGAIYTFDGAGKCCLPCV